jgi:NAD-dependent dihydropyrimidine dehydrogenase PreA subunit
MGIGYRLDPTFHLLPRALDRVTGVAVGVLMTFVVTDACVDVLDRSCIEECPVDCIYEGDRKMYINPTECIDCGLCEQLCPTLAAVADRDLAGTSGEWAVADNAAFFTEVLAGRDSPLGTPGGASHLGRVGSDTERITDVPAT